MPAIQPTRLRKQAAQLAEQFSDPPTFVRSLHHLLDYYADRTRRAGQSGIPAPLATAYRVQPQVLRQILQEIVSLAKENPQEGLALVDALWEQETMEFRQMAATLLGQIVITSPEVATRRVKEWVKEPLDNQLIDNVLEGAFQRLRQEAPQSVLRLAEDWLNSSRNSQRRLGLRLLLQLVQDPAYENLPIFYRLIHPFIQVTPPALRHDLLDMLTALAQRSPQETAYYLRQTLGLPNSPDTAWIIRQVVDKFPEKARRGLREMVRDSRLD